MTLIPFLFGVYDGAVTPAAIPAPVGEICFQAGDDNQLISALATYNDDPSDIIVVGALDVISADSYRRSILRFDISTFLPGTTVNSATLTLTKLSGTISGTQTFTCARVTQLGWIDSESTWNNYKTATAWATAGGDYTATGADTTQLTSVGNLIFDGLGAMCQYAIDNDAGLFNCIIYSDALSSGPPQFLELASFDHGTPHLRPWLCVNTEESLYYQCALNVVDQIKDLVLTNIVNNVVLQKVPLSRGLTMPGCTVSTWKADSMPITQGSNLSDDVSYPVTVTLFARNERSVTSNHARMLTWRNQIASHFRNQPLTGVSEVATCVVEPGPIFARNEFESGVDKSELTLRFYTRELR